MIVGIHQPNFCPWMGYWVKMLRSNIFVLLDNVPFSKGSYTNRVKVSSPSGAEKWLTLPVITAGKLGQPIEAVLCSAGWQTKIEDKLKAWYGKAPYYDTVAPLVYQAIAETQDSMFCINGRLLLLIRDWLGIDGLLVCSSELSARGTSTELLVNLCKAVGGSLYLSGSGGKNYQDELLFDRADIGVIYNNVQWPEVAEGTWKLRPQLSILDPLFHFGIDRTKELLHEICS